MKLWMSLKNTVIVRHGIIIQSEKDNWRWRSLVRIEWARVANARQQREMAHPATVGVSKSKRAGSPTTPKTKIQIRTYPQKNVRTEG